MPWLGGQELLIILLIVLLLFGPQKLPELARSLGKAVAEYRRAAREIEEEVNRELSQAVEKEITQAQEEMDLLREIALNMNIDPTGKSREELLREIKKRTS